MFSASGRDSLLTNQTNAHWRVVRRGVMPAFSKSALRYKSCLTLAMSQHSECSLVRTSDSAGSSSIFFCQVLLLLQNLNMHAAHRHCYCRQQFPLLGKVLVRLVRYLYRLQPGQIVELDDLLSRESLDVIGERVPCCIEPLQLAQLLHSRPCRHAFEQVCQKHC